MMYAPTPKAGTVVDPAQSRPSVRTLREHDIPGIVRSFAEHNWPKPYSTFATYWLEQQRNERVVWLAFSGEEFAGYITLKWTSLYEPFRAHNIPEIMDLNVLPPYRNRGIGSTLLDIAEAEAAKNHPVVGIGVGLYADYGPAQRLYYARGYRPDGLGVTYSYTRVDPGSKTVLDDDLVLWFTKRTAPCPFPYRVVDLTHSLFPHIPSWDQEGDFSNTVLHDYPEIGFRIQRLEMDAGIGTHVDSPSHMLQKGRSVDTLPIDHLIAPCVVIDLSHKAHERYSMSSQDVLEFEQRYGTIPQGSFVIVRTGWDRFWDTPDRYRNNLVFPSVSAEAISKLLRRTICGLGIDTLSPDRPEDGFPVHKALLEADTYIVENVANAHLVPPVGCYTICLPLKVGGGAEAPTRLMALCPKKGTQYGVSLNNGTVTPVV